jgi:hypothetical protein
MLPDGLDYVDSWIEPNFERCFQLMRCDDLRLLQAWVLRWRGLGVSFEIVPVVPSAETRGVVAPLLDRLEAEAGTPTVPGHTAAADSGETAN